MNTNTQSGCGFFGFLTILFIALKLLDKIDWSWWWVLSPMWMPLSIIFGICLVLLVLHVISVFMK